MLKFKSKIFEEITVDGLIDLKAERTFKWFKTFDLKISKEDKHILTLSTSNDFLTTKFSVQYNQTDFQITVENDSVMIFDNERFEIKVNRMYPFMKKYGDIWCCNKKIGELLFEKKFLNIELYFSPEQSIIINEQTALKIACLVLLNIADLDGSE